MLTNIRKPEALDINYIVDIDLKCFEDEWNYKTWKNVISDPNFCVLLGTVDGTPVSFIVWAAYKDEAYIKRVGVKMRQRGKGIGTQLLNAVEVILKQQGVKRVYFHATESLCRPDSEFNLSLWLKNHGYATSKLMRGTGYYCGLIEDEILFCKLLIEVTQHAQKT
jgi:N-acetylglutamate synthase-like GNAT family acetyltransferase